MAEQPGRVTGAAGDFPFHGLVGAILGVALDDDQLGAGAHLRKAVEDLRDIAFLIARRHDHAHAGLTAGQRLRLRTSHQDVSDAEVRERPQPHQVTIGQRTQQRHVHRAHQLAGMADHFEARQVQEVDHIAGSQPVLREQALHQPQDLGQTARAFPKVAVEIEEDPRGRMTMAGDARQDGLHIPNVVDQVGANDRVELLAEVEIVSVGGDEAKFRMASLANCTVSVEKSMPTPSDGRKAASRSPVPQPISSTRAPGGMEKANQRASWAR